MIRDLYVDMTGFFKQYLSIRPWLVNDDPPPERERLQSPQARDELDRLYECILCACCSSACPSYWWNPDKYVGPPGCCCRTILNCADVCPKGLNPALAIGKIKQMMVRRSV